MNWTSMELSANRCGYYELEIPSKMELCWYENSYSRLPNMKSHRFSKWEIHVTNCKIPSIHFSPIFRARILDQSFDTSKENRKMQSFFEFSNRIFTLDIMMTEFLPVDFFTIYSALHKCDQSTVSDENFIIVLNLFLTSHLELLRIIPLYYELY